MLPKTYALNSHPSTAPLSSLAIFHIVLCSSARSCCVAIFCFIACVVIMFLVYLIDKDGASREQKKRVSYAEAQPILASFRMQRYEKFMK